MGKGLNWLDSPPEAQHTGCGHKDVAAFHAYCEKDTIPCHASYEAHLEDEEEYEVSEDVPIDVQENFPALGTRNKKTPNK